MLLLASVLVTHSLQEGFKIKHSGKLISVFSMRGDVYLRSATNSTACKIGNVDDIQQFRYYNFAVFIFISTRYTKYTLNIHIAHKFSFPCFIFFYSRWACMNSLMNDVLCEKTVGLT